MASDKPELVIIGDGETAELAHDYFVRDNKYTIVGFSAEQAYMRHKTLLGLPVVAFEELEQKFDPQKVTAFVAVSYTQFNRLRTRLFNLTKAKGYRLCSYISPQATISPDVEVGENCFILEHVTIQRSARIGDNVIIWSGSSIAHQSTVKDNVFVASHVAVSGFCEVGENCFLGVNSCTVDCVKITRDCIVGAGAVVVRDTAEGRVYVGNPAKPLPNKDVENFILGVDQI